MSILNQKYNFEKIPLNRSVFISCIILINLCFGLLNLARAETTLELGLSISTSSQREAFYALARKFENENKGVTVHIGAMTSERYKLKFPSMLAGKYDVLYWHAGARLSEFVEQDLIKPLDDLWQHENLKEAFDQSILDTLTINQKRYGVPISYYQLGFYYYKPLFEKHGLTEPSNWREFLELCADLDSVGVTPIFIGTKSNWSATAWFDYLNIRINGLSFHNQTTAGQVSFLDDRFTTLFSVWSELIENQYFNQNHHELDWKQGLPLIYRGLAGMSMIGNYVIQDIPSSIVENIGFFPFPNFGAVPSKYEEAPVDILIIPLASKNQKLASRFLQFAARSDIQSELNAMLGVLSPHRNAQNNRNSLATEAYTVLNKADAVSQFFDRDAKASFANKVMPIIDAFMLNNNISRTQSRLESARLSEFAESPQQ